VPLISVKFEHPAKVLGLILQKFRNILDSEGGDEKESR
jgi:hypothetical protein